MKWPFAHGPIPAIKFNFVDILGKMAQLAEILFSACSSCPFFSTGRKGCTDISKLIGETGKETSDRLE
jgi:hypothetical protein